MKSTFFLWVPSKLTAKSKEGKQMVVLTMEGKPLGTFMLPVIDYIQCIKNERIYTIHRLKRGAQSLDLQGEFVAEIITHPFKTCHPCTTVEGRPACLRTGDLCQVRIWKSLHVYYIIDI